MSIIAHRASYSVYPENSIKSVYYSFTLGCHGIEIDIRTIKTGDIIVIHDDLIDRTTNEVGSIKLLNIEDCIRLEIPLFINLLEIMRQLNKKRKFYLFIDMKEYNIWKIIIKLITTNDTNFIILKSPLDYILKKIKKKRFDIKLALLIDNMDNILLYKNQSIYDILSIDYRLLNYEIIEYLKNNNKEIFIWCIEDIKKLYNLIKIDYICTGYPEKFIGLI